MEKKDHNRTYDALLIAYIMLQFFAIGTYGYVISMQKEKSSANVMWFLIYLCCCTILFCLTTLVLRHLRPELGRLVTQGLNIFLLLLPPFGMAIAIYGLLKVNRNANTKDSPIERRDATKDAVENGTAIVPEE